MYGVIAADTSLGINDYRANERTFDLLTQVAGRAGRGKDKGKVVIQTYNPEAFSIIDAKEQNYDSFYKTEINLREQLKYPPFCDIIVVGISGKESTKVEKISNSFYTSLKKINLKDVQIYKPLPAPIDKIKNRYRWRIILKCKLNNNIIVKLNDLLNNYYEKNINDTRIIIDINPVNML